ncbi:hypothetical protein [Cognatiyoonia sp. IB215182]|uniref:hypothetical protein n=1 Tax=Cognatiyoonia sp. IB215182 TaxID=3097353 RepID=UPI002A128390|nr:hypothetical protein [Cognatiyoonia sp. IB215182]MDX8355371.1 hypothetical protein [Cognatiyoonia sp. IB215182]
MELELLKRSWATAGGVIASTPAAAEVCDKVRPGWNPADGPINQFEDLTLFFIEPLGLIVLVLTVAAVLLRKTWIASITVTLLFAIMVLNISTWIEADDVTNSANSEGCITAPILTTTTLIAISAIILTTTCRSSLRRLKSHD